MQDARKIAPTHGMALKLFLLPIVTPDIARL
jgi:hypothetical protein